MNQHKYQIIAALISVAVLAQPETSVNHKNYRGIGAKLTISAQQNISPAAAALEDSRYWDENQIVVKKPESINLKAGEKEADKVIPNYQKQVKYKKLEGLKLNYAVYVANQKQQPSKKFRNVAHTGLVNEKTKKINYESSQPIKIISPAKQMLASNQYTNQSISNSRSSRSKAKKIEPGFEKASNDSIVLASIESVRAQGNIQLAGLPLIFDDQVVELSYESGILESPISYNFPTGFEAEVIKGQGRIVAKLWSKSSGLIGQGELELTSEQDYSRLQVTVKPVSSSHQGELIATNKSVNKSDYLLSMDASDQSIKLEDKKFSLAMDVKSQPLMVARLKDQKTSTLFTLNHKTPNTWPIYTDDYALFLANLLNKRQTALETIALVSGKVTYLGEPLSNVKLVVHQGLLEKPVTYFSSTLPNPSLNSTSSTGDFVASTDIDRPAAISVIINGKIVHRRDIPIGLGQVTHVNIEVGPQQDLSYELSSAFDNEALDADFYVESTDSSYPVVNGMGTLYSYSSDMAERVYVDLKNTEYISFTTWMNSDFKYGKLYAAKKSWFYDLTEGSIEAFNELSSIYIGYVSGADFKVNMDSSANTEAKIIYFDAEGNKSESGKSDGGFVILNIPPGQRTINVEALDLEKSHTQFFNAYQSQNFSSLISF